MTNLCNVDGRIVPEAEATVSVMDRGFLFGDSVYEVIRTRAGIPFAWPEHLARLHRSAAGLMLELDLSDGALTRRLVDTLAAAGNRDSYVRVIVTRGRGTAPNIDVSYATGPNTCVILVRELPPRRSGPSHLAIVPRQRLPGHALDPSIKSGSYVHNVMGLAEARSRGATDCLFVNTDGRLSEASTANLWIISGDTVVTPPLSAGLLAGVTRGLVLEMCSREGIPCVERDLFESDVRGADAVFLTATLRDIAPVDILDGAPVRHSALLAELQAKFTAFCDARAEQVYRPAIDALVASP
ncbi:MAG: aminotransferase class IV [Planctomycetes bacterium]|nr:aminotransferase class IV [Planctomycetota bacterium]MCB9870223.1 aminotransferase class IV [Planctomycetota bacterium]MCB9888197.1 aminotransferase class IV [Planctomycetota bacterium]